MTPTRKYPFMVAVALVIANMIGTGIFTSLAFQVAPPRSGFIILTPWLAENRVTMYHVTTLNASIPHCPII